MLTEDQAKEKICHAGVGSLAIKNGDEITQVNGRCIASACMAWRFVDRTHYRETELWSKSKNVRVNSAHSDDAEWRPVSGAKDDPPPPAVGYCGLVRKA